MGNELTREKIVGKIDSITKLDQYYKVQYGTGEKARLYILNSHVFRFYMSPTGNFKEYPEPINPEDKAKINTKSVDEYPKKPFLDSFIDENESHFAIRTNKIAILFDKTHATMKVHDERTNKDVLYESRPLSYAHHKAKQTLHQNEHEFFFGGGMQNGRFSHKGEVIKIANTNNWVDGGVTSPCPFYWSTNGYGVLRNTWQPGVYDFGTESPHFITTIHKNTDFDAFYFINSQPKDILKDYYELTGKPIFMPEYAFYQAHLNTFNRDYWVEVDANTNLAILFEDGKYYKKYQPKDVHGKPNPILESLNGEKNNYMFSARAMVDRYQLHDMPLGWFVPNDGYGSGYGQTDSLTGDIENLKDFAEYAREHGVHVALWTESNLEPKDPEHPVKGDRDLHKEVTDAGVVALKCDVAWIGSGYSFATSAVEHAAEIFENATKVHRKMIIMVDGWAGTQRHAGIWTGDQSGGEWEYIRFHIPTYIGSGLSGIPVVGSDMDGIYKGGVKEINVRDFQWKAFTPLQLNMDGWGTKQKTPFSFNDEATDINRAYLKLKAMMMPYNYTIGHEATEDLPMIRAMFLEFPDEKLSYRLDSQYQFMWGPYILVAPVYNEETHKGDVVRHGIYLPDPKQVWIDLFTGNKYSGGKTVNYIKCPLWKIPVFVKDGAIIPMTNANNHPKEIKRDIRIFNIYPNKHSSFKVFEDDGESTAYEKGNFAETEIDVIGPESNYPGSLHINIEKTKGSYEGMVKKRTTLLRVMASKSVRQVKAAINGVTLQLTEAKTKGDFDSNDNVYFFNDKYIINPYLGEFGGEKLHQEFLMIKIEKLDVTESHIQIKVGDYHNKGEILFDVSTFKQELDKPANFAVKDEDVKSTSLSPTWEAVHDAAYYEIERNGDIFTNIIGTRFEFGYLKYESTHSFRIRSVNRHGHSEWSDYIHVTTKGDPYRDTVNGVKVTCNLPSQPGQEVENLTDADRGTMWHTHWGVEGQAKPEDGVFIELSFDLGSVHAVKKVEYEPRDDAGNGTLLKVKYTTSADGENWKEMSKDIVFAHDANNKEILLNGLKFRYMRVTALETVEKFGSGMHFRFHKDVSV
ncbi:alpha-glucosidase 2-like isoform X2 [Plodia interpunctella]|nr:alpha-glucosidase 2-like isoform X2 [Plodia interpunctella]